MRATPMLLAIALALGTAACVDAAPLSQAPDGRPLAVTFADEFDSFRPWSQGQGTWRTWFRNGDGEPLTERTLMGNKELQIYVDPAWRPEDGPPVAVNPFAVHDGHLEISAMPAPASILPRLGGYRYVSGLISSQPSFSQTYGYFEMRAKLPRGKGVWPAFWLLPADLEWPPEIDVMESVGDPAKVYATAHSKVVKGTGTALDVTPDAFHTYAVSWDKDQIVWFVDGRAYKRQPTPPDMHKPMYMIANVALGGDWAGRPDASTPFPATLSIDFIRAYRFVR